MTTVVTKRCIPSEFKP